MEGGAVMELSTVMRQRDQLQRDNESFRELVGTSSEIKGSFRENTRYTLKREKSGIWRGQLETRKFTATDRLVWTISRTHRAKTPEAVLQMLQTSALFDESTRQTQ
jgi:hypothetical protein